MNIFESVGETHNNEQASIESTILPEDLAITQDDVRLVEAILFAATTPVSIEQIAERFPASRISLLSDILDILKSHYQERGIDVVQRDDRYAFRTAADLGGALRLDREQPRKFTKAAMETMAVIAYHQPVTRAEIENIRGVATSSGAIDALMEAGWIKPGKRREVPGRPVTWITTQSFLDHFGLEHLQDLPGLDELRATGLLDKRPAIEAMPNPADLFDPIISVKDENDVETVTDEDLIGQSITDMEDDRVQSKDVESMHVNEGEEA